MAWRIPSSYRVGTNWGVTHDDRKGSHSPAGRLARADHQQERARRPTNGTGGQDNVEDPAGQPAGPAHHKAGVGRLAGGPSS